MMRMLRTVGCLLGRIWTEFITETMQEPLHTVFNIKAAVMVTRASIAALPAPRLPLPFSFPTLHILRSSPHIVLVPPPHQHHQRIEQRR